ncbi:response regulator transcription factor [Actinophytocola sediminis]
MRIGLREIVENTADMSVVGEVADSVAAVTEIRRTQPAVVVVGHLHDCQDSVPATRMITAGHPGPVPRFLTVIDVRAVPAPRAPQDSTMSLLPSSVRPDELTSAIRMLSAGYSIVSEDEVEASPARSGRAATQNMTGRELDVLRLLAKGCTNTEMSKRLGLSESTIKSHVQSLLNKLSLKNRACVVIYAYEKGLVKVGENIDGMPPRYRLATAHG